MKQIFYNFYEYNLKLQSSEKISENRNICFTTNEMN